MAEKKITRIEATKPIHSAQIQDLTKKRKVAAYARVSTDREEQESSFEAQVSYYTQKIQSNPQWIFVEVYADEGITGTSTKKRDGFNRMIEDVVFSLMLRASSWAREDMMVISNSPLESRV